MKRSHWQNEPEGDYCKVNGIYFHDLSSYYLESSEFWQIAREQYIYIRMAPCNSRILWIPVKSVCVRYVLVLLLFTGPDYQNSGLGNIATYQFFRKFAPYDTEIIDIYLLLPLFPKGRRGIVVTYKAAITSPAERIPTHLTHGAYVNLGHWKSTGISIYIRMKRIRRYTFILACSLLTVVGGVTST